MRRLLAVAAVTAVAASTAACGDDARGSGEATVDSFGPYLDREADAVAASLIPFQLRTGARVTYTGSADFESDLRARVDGGVDRPDIAFVPQPGLIRQLDDEGALVPFDDATVAAIEENYDLDPSALTLTGGPPVFLPYRASAKSIVWYRPDVLDEHGWEIPTTLDELSDLVDEIEATQDAPDPWCFSIFAGSATGWPATDWVEDIMLRRAGPDAYDRWTTGELGFDSDEVREAFTEFQRLVLDRGRSVGGLRGILQTEVQSAGEPLFADPPGCVLYKQASFADAWFPDGIDIGPDADVDFFVLPGVTADEPAPLVVGGDFVVQFDDRDVVHDLVAYLATPTGAEAWAEQGGYLSLRTSVDPERYYDGVDARFAELLVDDPTTRFDASDLMPPAIGSDLLWEEITLWIAGTRTLDELVANLDDAYAAKLAEQPPPSS